MSTIRAEQADGTIATLYREDAGIAEGVIWSDQDCSHGGTGLFLVHYVAFYIPKKAEFPEHTYVKSENDFLRLLSQWNQEGGNVWKYWME